MYGQLRLTSNYNREPSEILQTLTRNLIDFKLRYTINTKTGTNKRKRITPEFLNFS